MKIKCHWSALSTLTHSEALFIIHPDDVGLFHNDIKQYTPKDLLTIEVKKWKPLRTGAQNRFFHKTVGYLAWKLGMDAAIVKDGIKQQYGYKVQGLHGFVPKPSHLCNKFEEMDALIQGCFIEAGEQGIDMRDYIKRWDEIKTLDKNTKV